MNVCYQAVSCTKWKNYFSLHLQCEVKKVKTVINRSRKLKGSSKQLDGTYDPITLGLISSVSYRHDIKYLNLQKRRISFNLINNDWLNPFVC